MKTATDLNAVQWKLQEMAAQQCAPVIFGIKPSNLLIIDRETAHVLKTLIDETGLKIRCLSPHSGKQVWFLFRDTSLDMFLRKEENLRFIKSYGYHRDLTMDEMLSRLCRRFQAYKRGETGFPHELGVFLGYPVEDVRGFIENNGKNYLFNGYWKVYSNEQEARKIFRRYQNVRDYALELTKHGIGFAGIARQTVYAG